MNPQLSDNPHELLRVAVTLLLDMQREQRTAGERLQAFLEGRTAGADAALIGAIHDAFQGREFTSAELLGRARWDDVPGRMLAAMTAGMSRRNVGIRLGNLAGLPTAAGLVVVKTAVVREGAVWRVCAVQDSQALPREGPGAPNLEA